MFNPNGPTDDRPPLEEKDFIRESPPPKPSIPIWIWLAVGAAVVAVILGTGSWLKQGVSEGLKTSPFANVTNRQLSLFLWQFPEYMRANLPAKEYYLSGFNYSNGKVSMVTSQADKITSAPDDILYLYHTWSRLLKPGAVLRRVPLDTFKEFLKEFPEWMPDNWPEASQSYKDLVAKLDVANPDDFLKQSRTNLPNDVLIAVTGYRNYYKEGADIDKFSPFYEELDHFVNTHPNYARNFWRNILLKSRPDYLLVLTSGKYNAKAVVSPTEMAGFLKVAMFNDAQSDNVSVAKN